MYIIKHRVNFKEDLDGINLNFGAEIDIRYHNNELILNHDPFNHHKEKNLKLEDFLENWKSSGPIILNIKTEGIEENCLQILNDKSITNWFFLDLSMPYFVKYSMIAKNKLINNFTIDNLAVRFSDKEPIEYALSFTNLAKWIWVDYFESFPLNKENYNILKENNFKICLVSPELQNHSIDKIENIKKIVNDLNIDAVCTKHPDMWI